MLFNIRYKDITHTLSKGTTNITTILGFIEIILLKPVWNICGYKLQLEYAVTDVGKVMGL